MDLKKFESNPEIAALLWHLNSGTNRFKSIDRIANSKPEDAGYKGCLKQLLGEISAEALTAQEKHDLSEEYYTAMGQGGYRNKNPD